ncbi:MAG TPA: host attachment protein [Lacunisphaera sp.]|nr:host attachment protein [Lacunisphaera sp.]
MDNATDHDRIAARAYRLWEERGRPEGRALEFWLEAQQPEHAQVVQSPSTLGPAGAPLPTNLDRALRPADRQQVRATRKEENNQSASPPVAPPGERFIVVLDRAHLRIYQVKGADHTVRTRFEPVDSFDLPAGLQHYTDRDTDQAGRFASRGGPGGGSIDERLPMKQEQDRRLAKELAMRLQQFLERHEHATWDYAAGPALHGLVLDELPSAVRSRLDREITKELVSHTPAELEAHFTP